MRPEDAIEIRELRLFRDCTDETFAGLVEAAFLQRFPAGVELIRENEPADFLYVVVEGLVEMFATNLDRETTVGFVQPLGTFILAAVLRDQVYLQSARTVERSRVLMIPAESVRAAMSGDQAFMTAIVGELALCYRNLVKDIKNQKLRSGAERLANWLLRALNHKAAGDNVIRLRVEKRALAARLGMTPENLSRAFNTLKPYGVEVNGAEIRINELDDLKTFAKPHPLIDDHLV
ncbi:MAG: cyclic nucleotide-binding domain-containing protein [Alphaproteobacteria bacterium]|nr:cyclic nucleotide-binding domain-containing protein [Alphaproteobacteria bacterium]